MQLVGRREETPDHWWIWVCGGSGRRYLVVPQMTGATVLYLAGPTHVWDTPFACGKADDWLDEHLLTAELPPITLRMASSSSHHLLVSALFNRTCSHRRVTR